jgi:hypothetical protein
MVECRPKLEKRRGAWCDSEAAGGRREEETDV